MFGLFTDLCSDGFVADVTCAAGNRASVVSTLPRQQSSSVFPEPVGSPASIRPPRCFRPVGSRALCFFCARSLPVVQGLLCISAASLRSRSCLVRRCHGAFGVALLCLAAGCWMAHCADGLDPVPSSFPSSLYPPVSLCLSVSQLVYTQLSAGRKRKHTNERIAAIK